MRALAVFVAALLASLLLYLAVFSVVRRPLTVGDIPAMLRGKQEHARSLPSPRLIVFAGSNGRFSHRCESLAQTTGLPCANLSLAVGVGLDFQFAELLDLVQAGDVVYLPLEYSQYAVTRDQMHGGTENALMVHDFRQRLWQQPPLRILRAYASFDLPWLVHGLGEMALAANAYQRRTSAKSLSAEGDERGHTAAAGSPYRDFLRSARPQLEPPWPADAYAPQVIAQFMDAARTRGARVIGGLPTVTEQAQIPSANLEAMRQLYREHGQGLLELPNASRYPLDCFFDTLAHLNEECQIRHSLAVGQALAAQMARWREVPP